MKKSELRQLIREEISKVLSESSKPANDATIRLHINTYTVADDPYEVATEIGKKYGWNQREIEKAEKIIRAKYIR
jgi:hypothetical protein